MLFLIACSALGRLKRTARSESETAAGYCSTSELPGTRSNASSTPPKNNARRTWPRQNGGCFRTSLRLASAIVLLAGTLTAASAQTAPDDRYPSYANRMQGYQQA